MTAESNAKNKPRITIQPTPLKVFGPCGGEGEENYLVAGMKPRVRCPLDDSNPPLDGMTEEQYVGAHNAIDGEDIRALRKEFTDM